MAGRSIWISTTSPSMISVSSLTTKKSNQCLFVRECFSKASYVVYNEQKIDKNHQLIKISPPLPLCCTFSFSCWIQFVTMIFTQRATHLLALSFAKGCSSKIIFVATGVIAQFHECVTVCITSLPMVNVHLALLTRYHEYQTALT